MNRDTLHIRPTEPADIARLMELFEGARGIMRSNGNLHQWAGDYPGAEEVERDMERGQSFVCTEADGTVVGTFAFIMDGEPTYARIYQGAWMDEEKPYGVIHRLAGTPGGHGVAEACLAWCARQTDNLRIDTHRDNRIMRHLMQRHGFTYCGIIYLANGDERLAYQRLTRH